MNSSQPLRSPFLACLLLALVGAAEGGPISPASPQTPPPGKSNAAPAPRPNGLTLTDLETQSAREPLGIADAAPRLSWRIASSKRDTLQTAYRVLVATKPELVREGKADVWDSTRVDSADSWVTYAGPALASRTRYYWSVRVWASDGADSGWSKATWFETAFLSADEWKGQWISGPERSRITAAAEGEADDAPIRESGEFCRPVRWLTTGFAAPRVKNDQGECREVRPAPMLRKTFRISKPVARARVYASGLAYDDLSINGKPASDAVLDPGFTDYSRTVLYTTRDVTALLRPGENVIATELGSGHFDDAAKTWDWGWDVAQWRATPTLRLDLYVRFTDGTEQFIGSDPSWKVSTAGPTRYDSYYLGETYDARKEIAGWRRPAFDDSAWGAARAVSGPAGFLRAQTNEPIRVVGQRPPGTRSEPSPGIFVYDIGQNLTGWAVVAVKAPAGTPVEIFYSEKLGSDGKASIAGNDLVFGQLQTDYYVAKGAANETWSPRFSYKGFQYVQLSGPNGQPLPKGVTVSIERIERVRSGLAQTATFESSNETLNRIHRNTVWAIQSNLHSVITDTPVYEKNAWTGDAALTAGTASILFDTERLYRKMFQDMQDAQTEKGEVPLLAPSNQNYGYVGKPAFKPVGCCGATPAWDAFWFVIPWESYQRYGNLAALEKTYPAMQKYLDVWIPQWTGKDGDAYSHTLTSGLGDWVPPQGVPTINALVSTAFYSHLTRIASDVARALGRPQDAARYDQLFADIRTHFNLRFLSPDGIYRDKEADPFVQTAQILPLAFGLVPEAQRAAVAQRLADDIVKARGGHAYVGVIGARYILPVLTATGHHDVAYQMATQTTEPSWGYWTDVAKFTALGEHWPATTRSRNHHFFGAIVQWFYEDLAGIRPKDPGYATIEFRPQIPKAGLDHLKASYESVRGTVASSWRRTAAGLDLDITVPANARGRVYIPAASAQAVTEVKSAVGTASKTAAVVARFVGLEGDRAVFEVGSGQYKFRVAP
jgi:alpha-L-rhamnosidase